MSDSAYASLRHVLDKAFSQASEGKGKERHAEEGEPFEKQQIVEIGKRLQGSTAAGPLFQAVKKKSMSPADLMTKKVSTNCMGPSITLRRPSSFGEGLQPWLTAGSVLSVVSLQEGKAIKCRCIGQEARQDERNNLPDIQRNK